MRTRPGFWIHFHTFTALAAAALAAALFGSTAQAADLGPEPLPALTAPAYSWTGFSFAVGGGLGILNADVNGRASRTDTFGLCGPEGFTPPDCPEFVPLADPATFISQSHQLNVHDLKDDGLFGTVRAAYDYQFAPTWLVGGFVDYDFYDIDGHARQRSSVSTGGLQYMNPVVINDYYDFTLGDAVLDAKVGISEILSVGARLGWLARPDTLLYVFGGYSHAWLDNPRFNVTITDPAHPTVLNPFSAIDTNYVLKLANEADGFNVGAGTEVRLGPNWSVLAEYRFMSFDLGGKSTSSHDLQCCVAGNGARKYDASTAINMDLDVHTVRTGLAYRF